MGGWWRSGGECCKLSEREKKKGGESHLHANAVLSPSAALFLASPATLEQAVCWQASRHVYTINKQQ